MDAESLTELWSVTAGHDLDAPADRTYPRADLVADGTFEPDLEFVPLEKIGSGGFGNVFRARQPVLHRDVALKMLREPQPSRMGRFIAEAVVTGQLEHPNVVPVHTLGADPDGALFLAMKLVTGETWAARLAHERPAENPDALLPALEVLLQVCNAVAFAHSHTIVHLDIKPANVMLGGFGEVLLMDWGLAMGFGAPVAGIPHRSLLRGPCGTPAYIPPELARGDGDALGPLADIYLLGAVLCELLTGVPPHHGRSLRDALLSAAEPARPDFPAAVPEELRAICLRALAFDPAERHPDVASFQEELRVYLRHRESLLLTSRAADELAACRARAAEDGGGEALYEQLGGAVTRYVEARELWRGNLRALAGERAARASYAETALRRGDLGLAASQAAALAALEEGDGQGSALAARIDARRAAVVRQRRRQRRLLGAALCSIIGLLILAGVLLEQRDRGIRRGQEQAERTAGIAQGALHTVVEEVRRELMGELQSAPSRAAAERILRASLRSWEELRDARVAADAVSLGSARARQTVGELLLVIEGDVSGARRELEAAATIYARYLDDPRHAEQAWRSLTGTRSQLVSALLMLGDAAAAQEVVSAALASSEERRALSDEPALEELHAELLGAQADILARAHSWVDAEDFASRCLALRRAALRRQPEQMGACFDLAVALLDRARIRQQRTAWKAAMADAEEGVEALRLLTARFPFHADVHAQLSRGLVFLAAARIDAGRPGAALAAHEEAIACGETLVALDPENASFRARLLAAHEAAAVVRARVGEPDRALAHCVAGRSLAEDLHARDPDNLLHTYTLCDLLRLEAFVLRRLGRDREADAALRQAEAQLAEAPATDVQARMLRAACAAIRGEAALAGGEPHEALFQLERARDELIALRGQADDRPRLSVRLCEVLRRLAEVHEHGGDWDRVLTTYDRAAALADEVLAADPSHWAARFHRAQCGISRARVGLMLGRYDPAAAELATEIERLAGLLDDDPSLRGPRREIAVATSQLAQIYRERGEHESFQALVEDAHATFDALAAAAPTFVAREDRARSLSLLALVRAAQGRPNDASEAFALAEEELAALLEQRPSAQLAQTLLVCHRNRLGSLDQLGREDELGALLERYAAVADALAARFPDAVLLRFERAIALRRRGQSLARAGEVERGRRAFRAAIGLFEELTALDLAHPLLAEEHYHAVDELGMTYLTAHDFEPAIRLFRSSLALAEGRDAGSVSVRRDLARTHYHLAIGLCAEEQHDEGLAHLTLAVEIGRGLVDELPSHASELASHEGILEQMRGLVREHHLRLGLIEPETAADWGVLIRQAAAKRRWADAVAGYEGLFTVREAHFEELYNAAFCALQAAQEAAAPAGFHAQAFAWLRGCKERAARDPDLAPRWLELRDTEPTLAPLRELEEFSTLRE